MKAAIIGCGRMGGEPSVRLLDKIPAGWLPISHAEALQSIPGIQLTSLCDTDETLLKKRGQYYQVDSLYLDYRDMLHREKPDIITIATRTPVKHDIIKYACEAGVKGIYVEKPLANSLSELNNCFNSIKKYNVKLAYGVNRRYHQVYRHAKELIRNGTIGEIIEVMVEHGEAQLLWSHPHTVDMILFFLDSTELVSLQASIVAESVSRESLLTINSDPIIENAFFKFKHGKTASIVRGGGFNIRIAGKRGNLKVHADGAFIQVNRGTTEPSAYYQEQEMITFSPTASATSIALTELIESVKNDSAPPISLKAIETGTKMLMGCIWSSLNEGKIIHSNDIPDDLIVTGKTGHLYA
jgi:scyllo-inositol 2-dehydrogenase (NAD+)